MSAPRSGARGRCAAAKRSLSATRFLGGLRRSFAASLRGSDGRPVTDCDNSTGLLPYGLAHVNDSSMCRAVGSLGPAWRVGCRREIGRESDVWSLQLTSQGLCRDIKGRALDWLSYLSFSSSSPAPTTETKPNM